jgi:hypothetical protein
MMMIMMNVHGTDDIRQKGIHTAEPLVPDLVLLRLKSWKDIQINCQALINFWWS